VFADALALTEDVPLVLERGLRLPDGLCVGDVESFGDCVGDTVDSGVADVVELCEGGTLPVTTTDGETDDVEEAVRVGDGESSADSVGCRLDGDAVEDSDLE
jgi:hypothetical protein